MGDFQAWVDIRKSNRKFLEPWEAVWREDEYTRTSFRYRIHLYNKQSEEDRSQALFMFVPDTSELIGAIGLNNIRRGISQMASLGYWISEAYSNQGYMTEATHLLLDYAFQDLNLHRVEAACLPANAPSIALLKKAGFTEEGYAKSYLKIAGLWQDHLLFARVKT